MLQIPRPNLRNFSPSPRPRPESGGVTLPPLLLPPPLTPLLAQATFGPADWAVLFAYLLLLVGTGIWFSKRESKNTADYFLAGRRMPMWAVSVSIIATSLSAATFVGAPEQSYTGDLTYLSTNIGGIIAVLVVAYFFIPAYYKNNCTTVYELLETRFGPSSKYATSAAFMVGRLFASGARIFIGAIPLSMILFGTGVADSPRYIEMMILSIAALVAAGTFYTLFGGIASVIWTDVIQTAVLIIAVVAAIIVLWIKIDMPLGAMIDTLQTAGPDGSSKLTVVRSGLTVVENGQTRAGFDPGASFTLLTAIFGFSLLNIAALGTDHDLVQRMLTCKNAVQGSRSVLWSMALGIPLVTLFLVAGLLLWVFYYRAAGSWTMHSPYGVTHPGTPDSKLVFVGFILEEMPSGLRALMLAGLFAAGVGSLTSAINSMAATFIKDFYTRLAPNRGERHYLAASRWAVLGWGIALGAFAVGCVFWQRASPGTTLIQLALGVMTFAYAGLLGVFATALFTRRGNPTSVIAALLTGFVVILLMQTWMWKLWTPLIPRIGEDLAKLTIAFPWHMLIGTLLAFAVCCAGKRPRGTGILLPVENAPTCHTCGYTLTGLPTNKCPECGHKSVSS